MASPDTVDVAVVGASPAGLAAARASAAGGLDTLLLEAGRVGLPEPPAVVGFQALWPEAWHPPPEAVRSRFEGVQLTFPGDRPVHVQAAGRIVDRIRFDAWAAQRAREAGARIRTETGPWEVRGPGRLQGRAGEVEAEIVVFADGSRSIAQTIVDPVEAPANLVWGVTHEIDVSTTFQNLPIRIGELPGGRTQLVPVGEDTTWHWTFARLPREEAIREARSALQRTARRRGWPSSAVDEARQRHVAPDPVLQRPARLAGPRTLVAGGAGGLGGLEVGLASGQRAGRAAVRALRSDAPARRTLEAYDREMRDRYGPGYRGLERLFSLAEHLPEGVLAAFASTQEGRSLELEDVGGLAGGPARSLGTLAGLTLEGLVHQARARLAGVS